MGFSKEWDSVYKSGNQLSIWPWTKLVSLVYRYVKPVPNMKVLELGCGAGANIGFFQALNVDYYAIEGSWSMVENLQKKYSAENIHIEQGDFTKDLLFGGVQKFDLIIDRSSLTHNATDDIENTLCMIYDRLSDDGLFIGIDWHSDKQTESLADGEMIDNHTKVFSNGYYEGLGKVHFSNENHLRGLLKNFNIKVLEENVTTVYEPKDKMVHASWDFVVSK